VGNVKVTIRRNLRQALWHLRRDDENKVIWIDALCINQDDDEEKGIQVQMMDRIFQEAKRVAVWLGVGGIGLWMDCQVP